MNRLRATFLLFILFCSSLVWAVEPIKFKTFVTDQAGILSSDQRNTLENQLRAFQEEKGSQVVVYILPTTGEQVIEDLAVKLFELNEIGRKGVDDGVLLVVATEDRRLKIEVGYGLEGAIPDIYAKRVIEDYITPEFKLGNYYGGIQSGVDAILTLIRKEPLPEKQQQNFIDTNSDLVPLAFGLFIVFHMIHVQLRKRVGNFPSSFVFSSVMAVICSSYLPLNIAAIIFAVAFFVFFFGGDRMISSSGSSRGSSSGGGGYSGGGGRSGGGGASGSW